WKSSAAGRAPGRSSATERSAGREDGTAEGLPARGEQVRTTEVMLALPDSELSTPPSLGTGSSALPPALTIGTHALLGEDVALPGLGLVIIDEQQKFGVAQREQLVRKGRYPHLLVMTATPIPRTLGLTLYGELDISILNEMPPGRGKVKTFVRTEDKL